MTWLNNLIAWFQTNWPTILIVAGVAIYVLNVINASSVHWSQLEGPWWRRFIPVLIFFITEIVSIKPSLGVPGRNGGKYKPPLTSYPPIKKKSTGDVAKVALIAILLASGCNGWKEAGAKTLNVLSKACTGAEALTIEQCGQDGKAIVDKCLKDGDTTCEAFGRCHTAERAIFSLRTLVIASKKALAEADSKDVARSIVDVAKEVAGPVCDAAELWQDDAPDTLRTMCVMLNRWKGGAP